MRYCDLRIVSVAIRACHAPLPLTVASRRIRKIHRHRVSISRQAVRLTCAYAGKRPRRKPMKYIMLIYQNDAIERQNALPDEEKKKVYADYQGINETPGVTPGLPMG